MTIADANPVLDYLKESRASVDKRFAAIDARVDSLARHLDRKLDHLRTELVDHMERLHAEINGRVADIEGPARGNSGGAAVTN